MATVRYEGRAYEVDPKGFLIDPDSWDEGFARLMAPRVGVEQGLTREHWDVIRIIRETVVRIGRCPLVYQTCREAGLSFEGLQRLFPTGYLRGACLLAGVTFREGLPSNLWKHMTLADVSAALGGRVYRVDAWGFLVDPAEWDEAFATMRALELKMPGPLSERHWKVIRFLRETFERTRLVPTVYEACGGSGIDLEELEELFPDGYHRGAVKLAGLRAR